MGLLPSPRPAPRQEDQVDHTSTRQGRNRLDAFHDCVKIHATDLDEAALADARRAVYPAKDIADVPEGLAANYFDRNGDGYAFSRDLRRSVIFGRHDLIHGRTSIARMDREPLNSHAR
jgi:chemotaxis methyl-accepting protein methylase